MVEDTWMVVEGADWKIGRLEGWKIGRLEDWKIGRREDWKEGRLEGGKTGRLEGWKIGRMEEVFCPILLFFLHDVNRSVIGGFGGLHDDFAERWMGVDGVGEVGNGCAQTDGDRGFVDEV